MKLEGSDVRSLVAITGVLCLLLLQACSSKYMIHPSEYAQYDGEMNQHIRLIRATEDRLFEILTHEDAFNRICPDGTRVAHVSPRPYQVGTELRTNVDHILTLEWRTRVEEVIPNKKIRLLFLDGFFAGGTEIWELKGEGECTRVSHTIIIQPKGFFRRFAWILKVRRKHDKMVELFLDNLKKFSETKDGFGATCQRKASGDRKNILCKS